MERPSKDEYYLNIAKGIAQRSTCLRRKFGAIIIKNDAIVSSGYNGSPRYTKNCSDIGECPRQKAGIPAGERYELCRSVHAEQNAIINAARNGNQILDGIMYLYGEDIEKGEIVGGKPCRLCRREIINVGIKEVIVKDKEDVLRYSVQDLINDDVYDFSNQNIKGY